MTVTHREERQDTPKSPLLAAIQFCPKELAVVGVFSGALNVLMLTGSLFMLQVYDRVLPSRSVPTLIGLVALVFVLYAFQGLFDCVRGRMLVRVGRVLDDELSGRIFETIASWPLKARVTSDGLQPLRDLDHVRTFLSSVGPTAFLDLPWMPLYLCLCFLFHFWIGLTALVGALLLVVVTLLTEFGTSTPSRNATKSGSARLTLAAASRRNAEVMRAMGMTAQIGARWSALNSRFQNDQQTASDAAAGFGAVSRVLRMFLQSFVLAVGAYLVILQEASAGIIIASSILTSRALAPIELAIAHWRSFLAARQSWGRIASVLGAVPPGVPPLRLPAPTQTLSVENLNIAPPGVQKLVVQDVTFRLQAGQALGIIGPSGSGKSSLARGIVSVWQPVRGTVRLDGAAFGRWSIDQIGASIGYLPQDVELFEGTLAENISRFSQEPDSNRVIAAAKAAQIHELVLRLPEGYETKVGESGMALSAGQRQRVALARALFGDPFLIVLDEPNANLDAEGDHALAEAIQAVRGRGGIVIVIAHRPSALVSVDLVLAMANGKVQEIGPKEDVLRKVLRPQGDRPSGLKMVADQSGGL